MNPYRYLISLCFCLVLVACSKDLPTGSYEQSEVGKIKKVAPGVLISKRPVKFHHQNANLVAEESRAAPGTEYVDSGRGYEYVIKLNSGELVSVAQSEDLKLKVKQHVLVIYGKTTRIMPDDGSES